MAHGQPLALDIFRFFGRVSRFPNLGVAGSNPAGDANKTKDLDGLAISLVSKKADFGSILEAGERKSGTPKGARASVMPSLNPAASWRSMIHRSGRLAAPVFLRTVEIEETEAELLALDRHAVEMLEPVATH